MRSRADISSLVSSAEVFLLTAPNPRNPLRRPTERIALLFPFDQRQVIPANNGHREVVRITEYPTVVFNDLACGAVTTIAACPSYPDAFWMELRRRVGRYGKVVHVEVLGYPEKAWRAMDLVNRGLATRLCWLPQRDR